MNFFGKMLTIFVGFAAFGVMVVSMFVYASHKNWQETAKNLSTSLNAKTVENQQLQSQKDSLEAELKAELAISHQEVSKLSTERVELVGENQRIQRELDQLRQQERTNTAAASSTQANNEKLTAQVDSLRTEVRDNQQKRDESFTIAVNTTDKLHQSDIELTSLKERNVQLAQQLGDKINMLEENGLDPNAAPGDVVPRVRGVVAKIQRSGGSQLIEVTIGSDDGLKPGHTLEVFRGDRYLGRAEILKTEPDRAVGRILRQFQEGQIQGGDDVATRFRIG
jgi:vacuolar-type H+-ATPase subunit I/STV1